MTAIAINVSPGTPGYMRPINPLRDLSAIADLVEVCFHTTMDGDGRRFLQDMRRSANDTAFLRWATRTADTISLPVNGFVWEDKGKIVGNVSLVPYHRQGKRIQLIANVATHPNYRRRGIGRILTDTALHHALEKHADEVWLQVREDNPGAINLYAELGFREQIRRTTWHMSASAPVIQPSSSYTFMRRGKTDWVKQRSWLERAYPEKEMGWYYSTFWNVFEPGLLMAVGNFFSDLNLDHWAAWNNDQLKGMNTVVAGRGNTDTVWAAVPPEHGAAALHAMLMRLRNYNEGQRGLLLDYPAHEYEEAIRAAGFIVHRTLLWMKYVA